MPSGYDLHTHSRCSDGTDSPTELIAAAAAAGLSGVALTDHDTVDGWDEAVAARPPGLTVLLGIELSCVSGLDVATDPSPITLHLLAYGVRRTDVALTTALATLRASRDSRAERMVRALAADGVPVSWADVQAHTAGTVGRPHVAAALVRAGVIASVADAFTPAWLGTGGRYYRGKDELDVLAAVALVRAAGGVTVFAHPGAVVRGRVLSDAAVAALAAAGLWGLEVDHPDHDDATRARLRALAADLGLRCTGSSDYHGTHKTVQLGAHTTPAAVVADLVATVDGRGVHR